MGDQEGDDKTRKVVFVTVGTTSFDALVKAVDSPTVKQELATKGYTHLLIQMGRGSYVPSKVVLKHFAAVLFLCPCCFLFLSNLIMSRERC